MLYIYIYIAIVMARERADASFCVAPSHDTMRTGGIPSDVSEEEMKQFKMEGRSVRIVIFSVTIR